MIRIAKLSDLKELLGLAEEFVNESNWAWSYSIRRSAAKLLSYIQDEECDIIVVDDQGLKGWAMIAFDEEFHDENVGYICKFYISKESRGTTAGRELIEACNKWFEGHNCKAIFATATANIGEGKAFTNLLSKYNYKVCGDTLARVNE